MQTWRTDPETAQKFDVTTGRRILDISPSGLNAYNACPRRFAYNKVIIPSAMRDNSGLAANVGTAMHEGIQEYFRTRDVEKAVLALAKFHPIDLGKQVKDAANYSLEASTITLLHAIEDDFCQSELVPIIDHNGVERDGTEVKFLIVIDLGPDCPVLFHYRGYIDLIIRDMLSDKVIPVDIKTMLPKAYGMVESKYKFDYQTTPYGLVLNSVLGNFENFTTAIFAVSQFDGGPEVRYIPYNRSVGEIEDFQLYLIGACSQIARNYGNEYWPQHPSACYNFNRLCHYHEHCHLRTLKEMQLRVNPSQKVHINTTRTEEEPAFTMVIQGEMI